MTSQTPGTDPGRAPSCVECGTRAEPGQSFCDACGAVLDWAGAPAAAGAARAGSADREPGWDAFARPGAGTGTSRTAHDAASGADARPAVSAVHGADAVGSHPRGVAEADGTVHRAGSAPASVDAPERGALGAGPAGGDTPPSTPVRADSVAPIPTAVDTARPHPVPAPDPHATTPLRRNDVGARPDATAATEPLPSAAPGPDPEPDRDSAAERARSLLVPVADPEPRAAATPSVAPVLPGRPVANRPQVRAPGAEHGADGGVPCPWCATPNRPDRHFCGRCALSMAGERQTAGRLPWWRRLLDSRTGETAWAGERPRLRRGFGRVMNWVVGAVVLSLLVFAAMNTGSAVQAVKDHFAKRAPVGPDSVKASRSYSGHGAGLAFDKLNNTWWGPGVSQSGEGQWLEASFEQPTRLLDLIITSGVSARPDQLTESALPHRIEARVTTADGKTSTRFLTLDQSAGGQRRKFRVGDVTKVRFIIRSAYGAAGNKQVSIAEIEFFGPSSANDS